MQHTAYVAILEISTLEQSVDRRSKKVNLEPCYGVKSDLSGFFCGMIKTARFKSGMGFCAAMERG